ncbi:MAG: phosphatidylserine decarboxylase family protein [Bacteroidetes bacterium]|nr:phosphatidylserine decarboxylase family protein [Bacteroidota bacterium]
MLSKYGLSNIIVMVLIATIMLILAILLAKKLYISIPLFTCAFLLYVFTFWFFRDPDRTLPSEAVNDNSIIISPADGVITEIVKEIEQHYLQDSSIRISIFLSPLDVHVNRIPISGSVEFYNYNPGKYIIANHPKASELNEQSQIGVKTEYGKVFFKQIVGMVARRLVCELKVGDSVNVGDRFGMMKFGSRMDIAVSPNTKLYVNIGDRVTAGETIIAKLEK